MRLSLLISEGSFFGRLWSIPAQIRLHMPPIDLMALGGATGTIASYPFSPLSIADLPPIPDESIGGHPKVIGSVWTILAVGTPKSHQSCVERGA